MTMPRATYRLQFTPSFTFADAREIVPYLAKLGISDIYASPIFTARHGSTHGYDVADPTTISSELGGQEMFVSCAKSAAAAGIGWVQDIVPNHMVFSKENRWLMDVLENGTASRYAGYFDIEWDHPYDSLRNRILTPVLGRFYGECLDAGEISVGFDYHGLHCAYYDHRFPLRTESYFEVFGAHRLNGLRQEVNAHSRDTIKFLGAVYTLKNLPENQSGRERDEQVAFAKDVLWELYRAKGPVGLHMERVLAEFNDEASHAMLDELLSRQHFRLSFWKVAAEELDYRRFFTINDLISLRINDERVFGHTHATLFDLMKSGLVSGLRVDHIDGLRDPQLYLERLREKVPESYLVVEKILDRKESLPTWPVHGTTGYDTLNIINGFFCDTRNRRRFDRIFTKFTGVAETFHELSMEKKRLIIGKHMAGDIDNLANKLKSISSKDRFGADITLYGLRRAFVEFLTYFPVYRTYTDSHGLRDKDRVYIEQALDAALRHNPGLRYELGFIGKFMLLHLDESVAEPVRSQWIDFCMRVQQFTGPIMAKGVEDTVLYIYNRLLSLNDVGSDPSTFGVQLREMHSFFVQRGRQSPLSMNTTATHDTKRGEDVRARLNVLSEIPMDWLHVVKKWRTMNAPLKKNEEAVPDPNDEYLFYQTALGTLPLVNEDRAAWRQRVADYMVKAVREAKVHTEWLKPDSGYEDAVTAFVHAALREDHLFVESLETFGGRIAFYGMLNSLSQTMLKLMAPGVPDTYQGTELWDLSLVDPDNRRQVDFALRRKYLDEVLAMHEQDPARCWSQLLDTWHDGRVKLLLVARALRARQKFAEVFTGSSYVPLRSQGAFGRHCAAFMRRKHETSLVVIVPRFFTGLVTPPSLPIGREVWKDTRIELKEGYGGKWRNELTGETVAADGANIMLADALQSLPVALLSQVKT
ncbi:MAG: malto-oligosyltrehalose synthase [Chitinispirillaceae bacterium]|jgi:(1->4)-alpha-D-glucan 1-alpha-D-glucosylmutase|nr:malto-oligosyltrehalose synthase [Chitinispirillaceae bacterium]